VAPFFRERILHGPENGEAGTEEVPASPSAVSFQLSARGCFREALIALGLVFCGARITELHFWRSLISFARNFELIADS